MNTSGMMTIEQQLETAAKLVGGKVLGADIGKPRICLSSSKYVRIYIDFPNSSYDTPDKPVGLKYYLGIGMLRYQICGRTKDFDVNEYRRMTDAACAAVDAVNWYIFSGSEAEARRFLVGELDIDEEALEHIANWREAEARIAVGLPA